MAKKAHYILLFSAIALLFSASCEKEVPKMRLFPQSEFPGLGSPIQLQPDSTVVHLKDYFIHPEKIQEIELPKGLESNLNGSILTMYGSPLYTYSTISFVLDGNKAVVPVKRSSKKPFTFSFSDPEKKHTSVCISGSMNGWVPSKDSLEFTDGVWQKKFWFAPGRQEYHLFIDGNEQLNPQNELAVDNGFGGRNSYFDIPKDSSEKTIQILSITEDKISLLANDTPWIMIDNTAFPSSHILRKKDTFLLTIPSIHKADSQFFHLRIFERKTKGMGEDFLIPIVQNKCVTSSNQLPRIAKHTYRMYFLMVDRFFDANPANNQPVLNSSVAPNANYMGGDISGVVAKVESRYFEDLGMNTIWLSPIGLNPQGAWGLWDKNGVKSTFSGFHGYWPVSNTTIDPRMGSDESLKKLIEKAHLNQENVILDYVANHVHEENEVIKNHPDWATDLYLPDGTLNTERWDEYRLTTWFDTFLPTLNLENPEAAEAMSDSALYWFKNYNIDGFRHDATKHIPESFWRMLTEKLKTEVVIPEQRSVYQIGETYGSPELIGGYISSGMLDGQFDFNLYDASVQAFAKPNGFASVKRVLGDALNAYGNHHLMGNISGNQDRVRFISYADSSVSFDEDGKNAGWTRTISNQNGMLGHERLAMLHAFNFSIPGIPVIYYGDEIGLAGANDPDNRRMMRFEGLNEQELWLKKEVEKIAHLRKGRMSLNYGQTNILPSSDDVLLIHRSYAQEHTFVLFNPGDTAQKITFTLPSTMALKALNSSLFKQENNTIEITLAPRSYEFLMTE